MAGSIRCHLAISPKLEDSITSVGYERSPDHRAEKRNFLADMQSVLAKAMAALERVQTALGLDYGGIDCRLNRQARFCSLKQTPQWLSTADDDPRWDYRRAAVARIHAGVREMLMRNATQSRERQRAVSLFPWRFRHKCNQQKQGMRRLGVTHRSCTEGRICR